MTDWYGVLTNDSFLRASTLLGVFMIPAVAGVWYALRVKQWELSLKQLMIERGMSVEEIKMVLEASSRERSPKV